jgi:thiamine pyrophosphate-dependent acetolactate synthase large subunit-like protein
MIMGHQSPVDLTLRPPDVMSRMWQELLQRHQQGDLPQERRADKGSGNSPKQAAAVKGSSKRERTIVVTDSGSESDEYNPPIDIKKNAKLVKKKELDVAGANGQRDIKTL